MAKDCKSATDELEEFDKVEGGWQLAKTRRLGEEYFSKPRREWGDGPWQTEPDVVRYARWGSRRLAVRHPNGFWCGYVGLRPEERGYGERVELGDPVGGVEVTFVGRIQAPAEPLGLTEAERELWWWGFDCAHGFSVQPAGSSWLVEGPFVRYWTIEQVMVKLDELALGLLSFGQSDVEVLAECDQAQKALEQELIGGVDAGELARCRRDYLVALAKKMNRGVMTTKTAKVHAANLHNPHRTLCGRNIFSVAFVVAYTPSVTCEQCRQQRKTREKDSAQFLSGGVQSEGARPGQASRGDSSGKVCRD